ncbi:hypothetical protein L1049_008582 [Liquidambar formosana]|uniref:PWWP domain-containing protein n=1 Tax=Liquidambar formosana TaxID=63359 RepID=A0AAP0S6L6_LIQFO
MPVNPDAFDLNADAVPGDRGMEAVHGVSVSEPTTRITVSATETLTEPSTSQGPVEGSSFEGVIYEIRDPIGVKDSAVAFRGPAADGVGVSGSSGREMEYVDRGDDARAADVLMMPVEDEGGDVRIRAAESLHCSVEGGGEGDEIAAGGGELGLDSTAGVMNMDASCGNIFGFEKEGGEDVIGKGSTEVEIMSGVEVLAEKNCSTISKETVFDRHGENPSMPDEKEKKANQLAEMCSGEVEGDNNVNPHFVEKIPSHGACVTVVSNLIPEERCLIKNAVDSGPMRNKRKPNYNQVTECVDQLPGRSPDLEVKVDNTNEFLLHKDHNSGIHVSVGLNSEGLENQPMEVETQAEIDEDQIEGVHVSEAGVSQHTGKDLNGVDLIVDLNLCSSAGSQTDVKDMLGDMGVFGSECLGKNTACHVDGVGLNGNQDIVVEKQVIDIEKRKATVKKDVKSAASKSGFSVSDIVWGKVRSHPWWPGQIFDPSDSSEKAMNYFKEDSHLIAYFGDGTFAWNEASRLKPFGTYFSQMEKQSSMESFRHAVDCALDEVSGRVQFGLACSCLSEEVYAKIKSQIIVNAGIQEESRKRDSGDEYSGAAAFEPVTLVEYIKELARFPYGEVDRLELIVAQAQLLSFYRWKGYPYLPELKMLGGLLENDAGIPLTGKKKHRSEAIKDSVPDLKDEEQVPSGKGKLTNQDSSSRKRKHSSADSTYPSKKERSLSDLMARNHSYLLNGENDSGGKAGSKLISSYSGRKRKVVESISDDSAVKNKRSLLSTGAANMSPKSSKTFKVGDGIRRVATQLNGSAPIQKYSDGMSRKKKVKNESKEKSAKDSFGVSPYSYGKSQKREMVIPIEWSSPNEMLSQLCVAAIDPMRGCDLLVPEVSFFTDFRNSVCLDHPSSRKQKESLEEKSGRKTGRKSSKAETTETSELEYVKDSYWTDRIIAGIPEEHLSPENQDETGQFMAETPIEKVMPIVESEAAPELSIDLEFKQQTASANLELQAEEPVGHINSKEELSPTALILNFTDLDSVPSETNLNKIFSRYGPLNESETEVLSKSSRAKVVFKRKSDAETAFSSAGKFSIFGPSLVSYRLKYLPSTPGKASSLATKRSRKDATSVESNAT